MLNNPPQKCFHNMAYLSDSVPFFHKLFNVVSFHMIKEKFEKQQVVTKAWNFKGYTWKQNDSALDSKRIISAIELFCFKRLH